MRLRAQYALKLAATAALIVATTSAVLIYETRLAGDALRQSSSEAMATGLHRQIEHRGQVMVGLLAQVAADPIYRADFGELLNITRAARALPDVASIFVYDSSGTVMHDGTLELQAYGRRAPEAVQKTVLGDGEWLMQRKQGTLLTCGPVPFGVSVLAAICVDFRLEGATADIRRLDRELETVIGRELLTMTSTAMTMALVLCLLASLAGALFARHLSWPMEMFARAARRIGEGKGPIELPWRGRDELGELADALRTMAAELSSRTRRLERALEEARTASRTKSEFLANMSHELRTPLNAIIGFSDALLHGYLGPMASRQTEYVGDINASGKHLLGVVNDILDLSKLESGRMALSLGPVDLRQAIDACVGLVSARARENGLKLLVAAPADLPRLQADELRVKQILLNLLSNAIKFTPDGGTVSIAAEVRENAARITVADTGVGMRREDVAAALEPFRQVDNSLARTHEGTGLGLPLVRSLTELHGGALAIESTPGAGTTVTVTLPADGAAGATAPPLASS